MNKIFAILFLFSFLFAGCGAFEGGGTKVKYPNSVHSSWKSEFNQAENAFNTKNYSQAEKKYKNYIQKYPYNELTDKSRFRLGQIAMLKQAYPQAIETFQALIKKTPDPVIKAKSYVKMGICDYRQQKFGEALSDFAAVDAKYLDMREKAKMATFAVKSSTELKEDLNKKAYYYALLYDAEEPLSEAEIANQYGSENIPKTEVKTKFKEWVELATPIEAIDRHLLTYRGKYSGPYLDYKLGKAYFDAKNTPKAQELLKRYVSKNSRHDYVASAQKMLAALGPALPVMKKDGNAIAVGVILPLSGKYEQYGNSILKGMECAASDKPPCRGVRNIRLIVKDSGGDPQRAAGWVESLVTQDKVLAILGPMTSAEVEPVAKQAQVQGVPLVALAQKKGVPALGDQIFRFSLTPSAQVTALLSYATHQKTATAFGILYPNNNYGQEFSAEFAKRTPEYAAKVVAKEAFAPGKEDITEEVRQMKLSVTDLRKGKASFDAVFVPDSYLAMGKVANAMAKAELGDILVLGPNAWNDASLPSRLHPSLKRAVFVDIYYKDSSDPLVQGFVQDFQSAYGYSPSTLEAMGYDSVHLLGDVFAENKISKREAVKSALLQTHGYKGVTGLKGFQNDREAEVKPLILGVEGDSIKELQ